MILIDYLGELASVVITVMSGLKLGDFVLDARRVLYLPSIKALVCSGLHEALRVPIAAGLRGVLERVDEVFEEYTPEHFIVLGTLNPATAASSEAVLRGVSRRWGKRAKIQFVVQDPDNDARELAEALGCEVYNELVWDRYRFVEKEDRNNLELQLLTIVGGPYYGVRVGNRPFGGMKLPVFLKGLGRLTLPSMDENSPMISVFQPSLERCDVFAVGHQRVLPLGKVGDLKPFKGIVRGLPISKAALGAKKRAPKAPLTD